MADLTEVEDTSNTSVALWQTKEVSELLEGISLAAVDSQPLTELGAAKAQLDYDISSRDLQVSSQTTCSTCGAEFEDIKGQRCHFRSDWHRYNLKQKLKGFLPISEDHFEEVSGDVSSISGTGSSDDSSDSEHEERESEFRLPKMRICKEDNQSDDEESYHIEGSGRRHPRVFFKNKSGELLSIYRCVIHGKKKQPETSSELINMAKEIPHSTRWAIFMSAGGHFAGAIFYGADVLVHKTFHRYVVRAKRGTAQSLRDKQGNAPKSGGASLRRYNEAALTQEIQELISTSWKEELKTCSRIFLRAPSFNKQVFFFGKSAPLEKGDHRIRMIPLQTRRPTFNELQRVHKILSEVIVYGKNSTLEDHIKSSPKKPTVIKPAASKGNKTRIPMAVEDSSDDSSSEEDVELQMSSLTIDTTELAPFACTRKPRRRKKPQKKLSAKQVPTEDQKQNEYEDELMVQLRNDLYTACKVGDRDKLEECIKTMNAPTTGHPMHSSNNQSEITSNLESTCCGEAGEEISSVGTSVSGSEKLVSVLNSPLGEKFTTMLHVTAQAGNSKLIAPLLMAGADPTNRDHQGQFPYVVSANKETKNEFRRFMSKYPDMYNYALAQIPGPLTDDMENEKKAKEAEKKKAQRKARKERLKEQKAIDAQQMEEERERQRYLKLSEREKRALAAERRLVTQKTAENIKAPVLSRCWQCGEDITGKVPFEYFDYKFCTPKCLKSHKLANQERKT